MECVVCGAYIPEGGQVCKNCLLGTTERKPITVRNVHSAEFIFIDPSSKSEMDGLMYEYYVLSSNITPTYNFSYLFLENNRHVLHNESLIECQDRLVKRYLEVKNKIEGRRSK